MTQVILSRNSRQIKEFAFEKQYLESEENWLGDGFFPREEEFFKLKHFGEYNDGLDPSSFGGIQICMSLDTIQYTRSIYSILDLLGDVGGLYSILLDLCEILVGIPALLFGSVLQKFLAANIFVKQQSDENQSQSTSLD